MNYIILIVGFIMLIKGADLFVDGSASIAKKIGIPAVIVGLTIVSLGTSAPELAVSVISALKGSNELTMGNVLGSNMFNTLVVLGATALVSPLLIDKRTIKKDLIVNIVATVGLYFLAFGGFALFGKEDFLSRFDGLILLVGCITYVYYLILSTKKVDKKIEDIEDTEDIEDSVASAEIETAVELNSDTAKDIKISQKVIISIIGVAGIIFGGKFVVDSATNIALTFGLSEKLVGLTIVAIGTSLPELVTSLVAAKKGENEIAIGNILGSNTFNILLILGISSFISPMSISPTLAIDLILLIGVTGLITCLLFIKKDNIKKLSRYEGAFLLALYIGYTIFIIIRN